MIPSRDYRKFYTVEAPSYERRRYGSVYGRLFTEVQYNILKAIFADKARPHVLEVACGTGHVTHLLSELGGLVCAVDYTRAMIRRAKGRCGSSVAFLEGDAGRLPFAAEIFDMVVSTRFLHLFPYSQQPAFLTEMARVLKPGGELVVDFDRWSSRCLLAVPYLAYDMLRYRRLRADTNYNRLAPTLRVLASLGFAVRSVEGVGAPVTAPVAALFPGLAARVAELHRRTALRVLAEQFIVHAVKER